MSELDHSRQAGLVTGSRTCRRRAHKSLLPMRPVETGSHEPLPDGTATYLRARSYRDLAVRIPQRHDENADARRPPKNQQPRINQQPTIKENQL
ncbi:MAG: hypothetical protein HKN07_16490 [Acidimicrobiia bacterium]|nr:hypothetical protein [Acidimicrobiia bacterium]